jgi:formamidopyrimidine-DNA glycosylase
MPELPEVETIVRGLAPRLKGAKIGRIRVLFPPLLRRTSGPALRELEGKRILGTGRRGKLALIRCEGGRTLVFHLKMTGQFLFARRGALPDKHTRLVIPLSGTGGDLHFRDIRKFGFMCFLGPASPSPEIDGLGPEPLGIGRGDFAEILESRRGAVKSLLLDQRAIAGIGNIYADEMLFRAGIHPLTRGSSLGEDRAKVLWRSMRAVLREAIARKGSSIRDYAGPDGEPGGFQERHRVYGREGEKCLRCGSPIRRIRVGGRSSFFCPRCQRPV